MSNPSTAVITADIEQDPPPTTVAVDIVLFGADGDRLRVLTIRRLWPPHEGCRALPGGLLEEDEDLAAAAVRELGEETGIHLLAEDLVEIGSSSDPKRDPRRRVLSVAFGAVLPDCPTPTAGDDASEARWMLADAVLDDPSTVAFDHHQIVVRAKQRLAEAIARTAPGTLSVIDRITTGMLAFITAADAVDRDELTAQLKDIRKSGLHDMVDGLDQVRLRVARLLDEVGDQVCDFTGSSDEMTAISECLEDAAGHLETVVDDLRS